MPFATILNAMAPKHRNSHQTPKNGQKAIYFEEGQGYFLLSTLGSGVTGTATLVRSRHDTKLYVRKEEIRLSPYNTHRQTSADGPGREIDHARRLQHIPGILRFEGWVKHISSHLRQAFPVSYWAYCNLGDLSSLASRARRDGRTIPAIWVAHWLISMLDTLRDIHAAGVAHCDAHRKNWFLHAPNHGNSIPQIVLGDFGHSRDRHRCSESLWRTACTDDYICVYDVLYPLLASQSRSRSTRALQKLLQDFRSLLRRIRHTSSFTHRSLARIIRRDAQSWISDHHSHSSTRPHASAFHFSTPRSPSEVFTPLRAAQSLMARDPDSFKQNLVVTVRDKCIYYEKGFREVRGRVFDRGTTCNVQWRELSGEPVYEVVRE